ncbi:MAG: hypothetical protein IT513_14460 [Burkholderiales bacterium]|nr:hypothetical protein [Burkholderiales bacterium]
MMRRALAAVLSLVVVANVFVTSLGTVAEALEHEQESLLHAGDEGKSAGGAHCAHGCAGHLSQHYQAQVGAGFANPQAEQGPLAFASSSAAVPRQLPAELYRPPLPAAIRS